VEPPRGHQGPGHAARAADPAAPAGTIESDLDEHTSELDHPADLAWNLFIAAYFKAGGFPWAPVGMPEGTCHLGVTFFRPHGGRSAMRTSVAQAFAENGDAFVLRGNPFEWEGKWPHLPAEEAGRLIAYVIDRYTQTMRRPPRRLVVHKQSRFFPEELAGFQDALDGHEYDLLALARQPASGSCATATTRRPGALAWTWETAATSTRPGTSPRSAATRTGTYRRRYRSPTMSATHPPRRFSPRCC
jgi:hypothetical protein